MVTIPFWLFALLIFLASAAISATVTFFITLWFVEYRT